MNPSNQKLFFICLFIMQETYFTGKDGGHYEHTAASSNYILPFYEYGCLTFDSSTTLQLYNSPTANAPLWQVKSDGNYLKMSWFHTPKIEYKL